MPQIVSITQTSKPISHRTRSVSGSPFGAIASTALLLLAKWRHHRRQRITQKILEGLDDRTLNDIGIKRGEIGSIVTTGAADHRINYDHLF